MTEKPMPSVPFQNRLIHEKSPYLLQHANNPVDWYPWGEEAFKDAQAAGKPIFLSIGYSTCHWCHVMAHESFEDAEVAGLMNGTFICIKVDREERPDIDKIYMTACQMLSGTGGWPLTVVMTPEGLPFYVATYLPKESRPGRPGMMDLIPRIRDIWLSRQDDVLKTAQEIADRLRRTEVSVPAADMAGIRLRAYQELVQSYDDLNGGFRPAPKFPMTQPLRFLLRYGRHSGGGQALEMVERTLLHMRYGGIYDHIGDGFHRYATDEKWLVPHFEKMLYDQALLAMVYLETYQATGREIYRQTAMDTFSYVVRDLLSPSGGFYAAEDADSEGKEGKFYLWSYEDVAAALDREDLEWFSRCYNISREGNHLDESTGMKTGMNILHQVASLAGLSESYGIPVDRLEKRMAAARQRLFHCRRGRVRPHRDEKVLTDWNGLMIAALSEGARVLGVDVYREKAREAIDHVCDHLRDKNGRLLHCWRSDRRAVAANLDDYAFFIWGLINYYEAGFESDCLKLALTLQEDCNRYFLDANSGGYFFTPHDGENIIFRKKEAYDGATPSGNAITAMNLVRLARLAGRNGLERDAFRLIHAFSGGIDQSPSAFAGFLAAFDLLETRSREVVVVGVRGHTDTEAMLRRLQKGDLSDLTVLFRPSDEPSPEIAEIAPFTADMVAKQGKATAYICRDQACLEPTVDMDRMVERLQNDPVLL